MAKATELSVARIRTKDERKAGVGMFTRLKTDEKFKGYALFEMNPEAKTNTGYYEYLEHYDNTSNTYVPCTGENCYMCDLGDNPSGRALTVWQFPDEPEGKQLKVFKMNGYLIRDFTEIEEEEGGVLGRLFRVKRLNDRGEYRATAQTDKPLKKGEMKALLKDAPDLEELVLKQARSAFKAHNAADALTDSDDDDDEDDDDEDEETESKSTSRKGKEKDKKKKDEDDTDDDDDDEEEEEDDEDEDEEEDDDDEEEDEEESDDEDEEEEPDDDDDEEDDDEEEEATELKGVKAKVTSTSEKDETITVDLDGTKTKTWVAEGLEVDWDKAKKGAEITIDAEQDDDGDWIVTKVKYGKAAKDKKDTKTKDKKKDKKKK